MIIPLRKSMAHQYPALPARSGETGGRRGSGALLSSTRLTAFCHRFPILTRLHFLGALPAHHGPSGSGRRWISRLATGCRLRYKRNMRSLDHWDCYDHTIQKVVFGFYDCFACRFRR
jgi:hypothetical protein